MKFVAEVDGNCLCIHREDFTNLMESPCMFIELTKSQIQFLKILTDSNIKDVVELQVLQGED